MIFFGHLGITIFVGMLLSLSIIPVIVGVLLPDVVDKLFFTLGLLPCGRSFAHNIFFGPIVASIVFVLTRKKNIAIPILFGSYMHLLEDAKSFVPWFYPIVNYNFSCDPVKIALGPFEIVTELIGIILLLAVFFWRPKIIYLREKLDYVLKHYVIGKSNSKLRSKKRRNQKKAARV